MFNNGQDQRTARNERRAARLLPEGHDGHLFRLRLQSQTERLDAPSELRKNRRLIARIKTVQRQRELKAAAAAAASETPAEPRSTVARNQFLENKPCPSEL